MASPAGSLGALDSRRFERELPGNPLVILPVGALEAHGPHLPLAADQWQADAIAQSLAARLRGWVAPSLPYGVCQAARRFPGTVSLSLETLTRLTDELLGELGRGGVRRVLVLSGHGEATHLAALRAGAERAVARSRGLSVAVVSLYDFVYERRGIDAPTTDGHAGLLETSVVLHLRPGAVGADRPHGRRGGSSRKAGWPTPEEWPESVDGDTAAASPELGGRVVAHVLDRLAETVEGLLPP